MRKQIVIYLLIILLLIGAGVLFFSDFQKVKSDDLVDKDINNVLSEEVTKEEIDRVLVSQISGTAERFVAMGRWEKLKVGEALAEDDLVRTRNSSSVLLNLGDDKESTIELAENSEIEVRQLSEAILRLGLKSGIVSVDYKEDGQRVLNLENDQGDVVARVRQAKFSMMNNGKILAVATEAGEVDLSSAGENVTVTANMQSMVVGSGAPVKPYQIPVDDLLLLAKTTCRKLPSLNAVIRGHVAPGSSVNINTQKAKVEENGRFVSNMLLKKDQGTVDITVEDLWGKVEKNTIKCVLVKPSAPIKNFNIDWGQKENSL